MENSIKNIIEEALKHSKNLNNVHSYICIKIDLGWIRVHQLDQLDILYILKNDYNLSSETLDEIRKQII